MKDAIGKEVKVGDVVFTTRGSYQSIANGLAIVLNPDTATIQNIEFKRDRIWDEAGFNYKGEPDEVYGWYNSKGEYDRKFHYENERYEFAKKSSLQLKFRRSVVININDVENDMLRTFLLEEQKKLIDKA